MSKASEIIHNAITPISDHGNAVLSKLMTYVGVSASGVGVADGAVKMATNEPSSNVGMICGIGGLIVLVLKHLVIDTYFATKRNKREQELHNKKLGDK